MGKTRWIEWRGREDWEDVRIHKALVAVWKREGQ